MTTDTQGYLGKLIAHYRRKRDMSLQDVADEAQTSKGHVWDIERGRSRNPGAHLIFGLSVALDCPPEEILRCAMADMPGAKAVPDFPPPECQIFDFILMRKREG